MQYGTVPGAPLLDGKTFFVFTYIGKEDFAKISKVSGAPRNRNVNPARSIPWLVSVIVDDAKSLLSAVSDASTRVNLSSYIVNGFCRKYAN